MNPLLKQLLARYMAPADENGTDTSGADTATVEDRGDDHVPTDDEPEIQPGAEDEPADGEGEAQPGTDAALEPKPAPGSIPKPRFDQVNQQRKDALAALDAANAELQRYREQEAAAKGQPAPAKPAAPAAPAPTDNTVEAQEEAYEQALLDGDVKKAAQIRRELNSAIMAQAREEAVREVSQRHAKQLLKTTAENVQNAFPWLGKPEGAEALELIMASRNAKIARGMPMHLALLEAANTIAPKFAPADESPSGGETAAAAKKDTRPAAALARGAEDSTAQPPVLTAGIGQRATAARINVATLTEEQFEALTPAEKKRLRGD